MASPTHDDRSTFFARATEVLYWLVVIDLLVVVASLPTVVIWMLLAQDASNLPLYLASSLFVPPAVSAAFFAWQKRSEDPDPVPLLVFLRGYRLNVVDSLRIGVPAILLLVVLSIDVAYGDRAGAGALRVAFVVVAAVVVLVATRALSIASSFRFRFRDILRLSVFTLLVMPLRTLALVSFGVLAAGLSVFIGDYALLFMASLLTLAFWSSERPVHARLRADFVAVPGTQGDQ